MCTLLGLREYSARYAPLNESSAKASPQGQGRGSYVSGMYQKIYQDKKIARLNKALVQSCNEAFLWGHKL